MSSAVSRAFSSSSRPAMRMVGATTQEILRQNPGEKGEKVLEGLKTVESNAEEKYGDRAAYIKIQGTKLHKSTKDPNETMNVVTVSVHTESGTRLQSDHIREDGTITTKTTRSGGK